MRAVDKPQRRPDAKPNRNHGALPAHLPRYEVLLDIEHRDCPCCGGALHVIDELRSEQLDIVPAQLRVRVTRRPRYACRTCEGAVVVAPAPERPIDGGMATEALVTHVVVSKFCELAAAVEALARPLECFDLAELVQPHIPTAVPHHLPVLQHFIMIKGRSCGLRNGLAPHRFRWTVITA